VKFAGAKAEKVGKKKKKQLGANKKLAMTGPIKVTCCIM
jgi:hypothetical protein